MLSEGFVDTSILWLMGSFQNAHTGSLAVYTYKMSYSHLKSSEKDTAQEGCDVFTPHTLLSQQNIPHTAKHVTNGTWDVGDTFSKPDNRIGDDISASFKQIVEERWTKPKNHTIVDSSPALISLLTALCA